MTIYDDSTLPAFFPTQTDAEVYAQMVLDLPPLPAGQAFNTREGSLVHAFLATFIYERRRLLGYMEEALNQTFLLYATGEYLDAKAAEYGIARLPAQPATTTLTIYGTNGVVVPAGSSFSTEGDPLSGLEGTTFVTANNVTIGGAGWVEVSVTSTRPGADTNVEANTIILTDQVPTGVTGSANLAAATGGSDEQTDEELRAVLLQRVSVFPEGANANFYTLLGLARADVGSVQVVDRWKGPGTAQIVISGRTAAWASPEAVDDFQNDLDPSVITVAHFEAPETWSTGTIDEATPLEGEGSLTLAPAISATATSVLTLSPAENLSAFPSATTNVDLTMRRNSASTTISSLLIRFIDSTGKQANLTVSGATINAVSNIATKGTYTALKSAFTLDSGFSWASVASVTLALTATGTGAASMTFDALRFTSTQGGFTTGRVPLGIQVTVVSSRSISLAVAGQVVLDTGVALSDVLGAMTTAIQDFFATIPAGSLIVLNDVRNVVHDTPGVYDFTNITIAGAASNYQLLSDQRPVLATPISVTL